MKYWLTLYILLLFQLVTASYPNLKFYHITHEQGLSQSTVNSILKDSDGFFWFCTNDGLNKWNGYNFKYYFHDDEDKNSLGLGRVNTIIEDSEGTLWVGTNEGGLCKYIKEQDYFINYPLEKVVLSELEYNNVTSISEYDGKLLIGTFNKGVYLFDRKTEKYSKVELKLAGDAYIAPTDVKVFLDSDSTLWYGCSQGIIKINHVEWKGGKAIFHGVKYLDDLGVIDIYEDSFGDMWFGTYQAGAFRFQKDMTNKLHLNDGSRHGKDLNHPVVRNFAEDTLGNLWIGTGGGGVNIYNYESGDISYFIPELGNRYSISSNIIYYLFPDTENNIWVGTYNGGVSYTNWYKQSLNHVRSYGTDGDINNNAILSFCELDNGHMLIGTDGGGINLFNPATNKHHVLSIPGKKLPRVITVLKADSKGNVYIGSYREGFYIYNYKTGYFKHYTENQHNSISNDDIWDIAISGEEETVWIGTLGGGLNKYVPKEGKFTYYEHTSTSENTLTENYISALHIDSKENLWVGTLHRGVSIMPADEEGVFYTFRRENSNLGSNEVRTIFENSRNQVMIGNQDGGLNIFNPKTNRFKVFDRDHGLPNNSVAGILEDQAGNIWVSTNRGISKIQIISSDSISTRNYSAVDGLQANEFNPNACFQSKNGRMYFGGVNGYNAFKPEDLIDNANVGRVILTKMFIYDQEAKPRSEGSPLNKSLQYTKKIKLDHAQSTLSFEYAMLDYNVPALNRYQYRLLGLNETWTEAGTLRRATYTNLDPGTYFFEVRGVNSQGVSSDSSVSLEIYIKPPFYKTWLFRLAFLILGALILFEIYRFRVRTFRIKGEMLKSMVDERTKELRTLNEVLENRNKEIFEQSEVLMEQQAKILESNKELEKSYKKIELQNVELENHRNNLEEIVQERTLELERAKIKAEESEQLKMAFLSNMSHEIRTPMNAIVGFASLLADEDMSAEDKDDYINQINKNSDALLILIDDILDLSKIEANQLLVKKSVFEINSFVNEIYFNWQHIQQKDSPDVVLKYTNPLSSMQIFVNSDELRLRQILNNLLDNAFKFTSKGVVEIGIEIQGDRVVVMVKDSGIGIHAEHIHQIFNRFRKGEETGKKLYRGAGLGLAISNKLAQLLDGKLWVESEHNEGATFYISLPIGEVAESESKIEVRKYTKTEKIDFTGKQILIAEDEEANYLYLEGVLKRMGIAVDWAQDGEEAYKKVSLQTYDLVLMDIKMPVMDGLEATRKIKSTFPKQTVVAQTAFARPEEENKFRQIGFDDYIVKPIKKNVLTCLLEKYMGNHK